MKLGIIVALPQEAATLVNSRIKLMKLYSLGNNASVVASGMGAVNATKATQYLLSNGACAIVSWGLAGGLTTSLKAGDIVLPSAVLNSAAEDIKVDPDWQQRIYKLLCDNFVIHQDCLAHTDVTLVDEHLKMALHSQTNAVATDMESAAIAAVAQQANVPFIALRVIVDPVNMRLSKTLIGAVTEEGKVRFAQLCIGFLRRPIELIAAIKLAVNSIKALRVLRNVAHNVKPDFCYLEK